ncbi:transporter substrate-binding domain-containing protein [Acidaminobacterium chupaoyuni]
MNNLKKWAALVLAGVTVLAAAGCAKQESQQQSGSETKKEQLVLATSADYAPFEFHKMVNGKDTIMGFDISLAQEIADQLGKELVIKDMDFGNVLTELQNGNADMAIAALSANEERKKQVDFSDVYFKAEICCIIRKEDSAKYPSLESFNGVSVAAQTGSVQETVVKEQMTGAKLVSLAKMPEEIMQLTAGKVDAVVSETAVAAGYIASNPDLMIASFKVPYDSEGSSVAVQKGNTELAKQINEVIAKLKESGKMGELIDKANEEAVDAK